MIRCVCKTRVCSIDTYVRYPVIYPGRGFCVKGPWGVTSPPQAIFFQKGASQCIQKSNKLLQPIANAGRCVLDYDRYGRIRIHSLFRPECETTSNGTTDYSDVSSIDTQTAKTDFATYENNRWLADGKMVFLPKSGIQNAGYVSLAVSDENGLFAKNPIITRTLSKLMAQKLQLHSQKQQSQVVTNAPTRREQHWQMALTPYLLKHPTMMEMQQALRRFHSLLIQFHRHLLLQIQQMDLSQIRQLWLYLVKQTMLHLNLSQLQSMAHPLQLILMVHSARKLLLLVVPIQLLLLQRIRLARLQL